MMADGWSQDTGVEVRALLASDVKSLSSAYRFFRASVRLPR